MDQERTAERIKEASFITAGAGPQTFLEASTLDQEAFYLHLQTRTKLLLERLRDDDDPEGRTVACLASTFATGYWMSELLRGNAEVTVEEVPDQDVNGDG